MKESLYMVADLANDAPDVGAFRECLDATVHPVALSDYKHIWDFIGLVEHRYVDGLYLPSSKLAETASGYSSFTETPTGFADTLWWNLETGCVCGNDSAFDALVERITPFLFGKSEVMGMVLGTGRMAKAAVAALYPVCIYLNIVSRGDSPTAFDIEMMVDEIIKKTGKPTCAVEGTMYDSLALEPMDVIVNATPVPLSELCPGFKQNDDQLVIDLPVVSSLRATLYNRVITAWTSAPMNVYLKNMETLNRYYGCHS